MVLLSNAGPIESERASVCWSLRESAMFGVMALRCRKHLLVRHLHHAATRFGPRKR